MIEFSGCDYLGLRTHPAVIGAARASLAVDGLGAGASRATTGEHPVHLALERAVAGFLGTEAALLLPSGALANLALCATILEDQPTVWVDPRAHTSLRDGLRFGGREVPRPEEAKVILTDGVFPSRGEEPDLPALLAALPADGHLVVDDCHGTGVLGARGRGSVNAAGLEDPRIVITTTFSKALGGAGGVIATRRVIRDRIAAHPLHVGSTALPPAWAAAGLAALELLRNDATIHGRLLDRIARARAALAAEGVPLPPLPLPVFRFDVPAAGTDGILAELKATGLSVPHIHYPDGPPGGYLRAVVSAERTPEEIERLAEVLGRWYGTSSAHLSP